MMPRPGATARTTRSNWLDGRERPRGVVHEHDLDPVGEHGESRRDRQLTVLAPGDDDGVVGCDPRDALHDPARLGHLAGRHDDDHLSGVDGVEDVAQGALEDRQPAQFDERLRLVARRGAFPRPRRRR